MWTTWTSTKHVVDYMDLNKACPKDRYPVPRIDALVDSTFGYEFLNFMDAFSKYHQIKMKLQDQIHTSSSRGHLLLQCNVFRLEER